MSCPIKKLDKVRFQGKVFVVHRVEKRKDASGNSLPAYIWIDNPFIPTIAGENAWYAALESQIELIETHNKTSN